MSIKPLRIATRRSPLAVAQTTHVQHALALALGINAQDRDRLLPIKTFVTAGDINMSASLSDVGGKGLFTKEIELALLEDEADIAIHSMKDMPALMPNGLVIAAVPPREDPRDAFVTQDGRALSDMPAGSRIGTSSTRRAAQVRRLRPDLDIVPMRGNVGTRLQKLIDSDADGTFLAEAGLRRLGRTDVLRSVMEITDMLPALGQGTLCIQTRSQDERAQAAVQRVHCLATSQCDIAERAVVAALDGSCKTPMAGIATIKGDTFSMVAEILTPDGTKRVTAADRLSLSDETTSERLHEIGQVIAQRMRDQAGDDLVRMLAS